MTTFDLADVRRFTADLDARMDQCDDGEGMECANLDGTLWHYAALCCEFCERVRQWGRAIFYGQAAFDPEVEKLWLDEGMELFRRASGLWAYGQEMKGECFVLQNGAALGSSLWRLERLLSAWVTPKRTSRPAPISPVTSSSTTTRAWLTRWMTARIEEYHRITRTSHQR